jgi:hypothetical protein
MAIGTTVQPPLMKNGNPLSAASVNQLIEATNFYGENVFGSNIGWQKFIGYGNITNSENRFAIVHKYDTLYIKLYHVDELRPLQVYARKAGQNQTLYVIHTADAIPVNNTTILTFNLASNPGGFSVNNGETYFIFLEWDNATNQNGMIMVEYLHEQQASYWTVPTIPTLTSSTVVDDSYLNTLVNAVRNLRTLNYSTNFGFVGIKTNQFQAQSNTYLRWRLKKKNRYLQVGLTVINQGIIRIYLNDQEISNQTKTNLGTQDYQYVFDFTNLPGITIPSDGVDYEIKVRFSIYDGNDDAFIRANYVWELPTP